MVKPKYFLVDVYKRQGLVSIQPSPTRIVSMETEAVSYTHLVNRAARIAVPQDRGFALVGDADACNFAGGDTGHGEDVYKRQVVHHVSR